MVFHFIRANWRFTPKLIYSSMRVSKSILYASTVSLSHVNDGSNILWVIFIQPSNANIAGIEYIFDRGVPGFFFINGCFCLPCWFARIYYLSVIKEKTSFPFLIIINNKIPIDYRKVVEGQLLFYKKLLRTKNKYKTEVK